MSDDERSTAQILRDLAVGVSWWLGLVAFVLVLMATSIFAGSWVYRLLGGGFLGTTFGGGLMLAGVVYANVIAWYYGSREADADD